MNSLNPQNMTTRPFARVGVADALPGHCIRCPRNADLVDLGAPGIPNFGVVYICTVCLGDLMNQMKVVGHEQYQAVVDAAARRETALQDQLADAIEANRAPIDFITTNLEEFSHGVEQHARDLVARLRSYSAPRDPGDDRVAAVAAEQDEPGDADVPLDDPVVDPVEPGRVADPEPVVDAGDGGDDAGEALVATLLGVDYVPAAHPGGDAGAGGGDVVVGESGDLLGELYGEATR